MASTGTSAVPVADILGPSLLRKEEDGGAAKKVNTADFLQASASGVKYVALYFSASWCGPCVRTTPLLVEAYLAQEDKKDVEVIFVSMDNSQAEFDAYYSKMPWCAVPFDSPLRKSLPSKFSVMGIPCLTVLSLTDGHMLTKDAIALIRSSRTFSGVFTEDMADSGSWCVIQ